MNYKERPEISTDISLQCMLSIVDFYRRTRTYRKAKKKIPDDEYRYIGTWGTDRFTKMKERELCLMVDPNVLNYIRKKTSCSNRLNAVRWTLRGLSPYDAVRKVCVS